MNIKFHKIIFSVAVISFSVVSTSCMEIEVPQWVCTKTMALPADVSYVTLANNARKAAFIRPGKVNTITFKNDASYKRWTGEASLLSFDDNNSLLGCLAIVTKDNDAIICNPTCTITLPKTIDEQYTAIKCINGRECLVGSDKGNLWHVKANEYPVLLRHYSITDYPSDPTCSVVACDEKNNLYATLMIDALGGNWMFAGDTKDMKEGWADGNMDQPTDVCFNKDGSLVAFASGNIVLVYVAAILEKYKQVALGEKNNTNRQAKASGAQYKACITYPGINAIVKKVVFNDNNMQIFAGFADGKVYCSEIKDKGQSTLVVEFGEPVAALASRETKLAVAGLKKVCLYSQQ